MEYLGTDRGVKYENGHAIGHFPTNLVVARDGQKRFVVDPANHGCATATLSPDGRHELCISDRNDTLVLKDTRHPNASSLRIAQVASDTPSAASWVDDERFMAVIYDKTCPFTQVYGYEPARVTTMDLAGRVLERGPCVLGVVAGKRRSALMGVAKNGWWRNLRQTISDDPRYYNTFDAVHMTWSVDDGKTWHPGMPLVFDGNDTLLYAAAFGDDVRTEYGQVAFTHVGEIQWSR